MEKIWGFQEWCSIWTNLGMVTIPPIKMVTWGMVYGIVLPTLDVMIEMGVSINGGSPIAGWFVMEKPIKMDDLGVPPNNMGKTMP